MNKDYFLRFSVNRSYVLKFNLPCYFITDKQENLEKDYKFLKFKIK